MKVLQGGIAKSGNYWLWKIIQQTFDAAGIEKESYIRRQSIYPVARGWELSFPEQAEVDMIGWRTKGEPEIDSYWWVIEPMFRRRIQDLDDYVRQTNHAWTHANFRPAAPKCLRKFDKILYIIRDPRDVVLSFASFVTTPFYLREYAPPGQFLTFEQRVRARALNGQKAWKEHVGGWIRHRQEFNIHCIFYERLVSDFHGEYRRLLDYLELDLDDETVDAVYRAVRLRSMKSDEFAHVNQGKIFRWMTEMPEEGVRAITENCFELLDYLGYPTKREDQGMPSMPALPIASRPVAVSASLG